MRGSNKRKGYVIDPEIEAELQVGQVFFGQGRNREPRARQVDALSGGEHAAHDHFAVHIRSLDGAHLNAKPTVGQQHHLAGAKV